MSIGGTIALVIAFFIGGMFVGYIGRGDDNENEVD